MIEIDTEWKGGEASRHSAFIHETDALPGELYLRPNNIIIHLFSKA